MLITIDYERQDFSPAAGGVPNIDNKDIKSPKINRTSDHKHV